MSTTLTISVGESKRSTNWVPEEISWERLCKRLQVAAVTQETVSEYAAMSKEQRGEIKDVGGFVGGRINGGNRKNGAITDRQLVCLDADFGNLSLWDTWDLMVGKACVMHSSHSHTPESPRLRFVIPLSRAVSAEEYEPIARRLAEWMDINAFDDTTYEASRLMFWPSCSRDAKYICRVYPSEDWVNPDEVLATYRDWHDISEWPTSVRQDRAIRKQGDVQGNPVTKPGVIGAFNRAYTITEAIEAFLPDVYSPCEDGRWTYTAGSSTGGAVIYDDDRFIYSYHDTDPISHRLCNAFDMVRIHLYRDLDEGSEETIGNLPSMDAMKNLCQNDEKVLKELTDVIVRSPDSVFECKLDLLCSPDDTSDQAFSVRLVDECGYLILHSDDLGFLVWDGTKWLTSAKAETRMLIMRFLDNQYVAAKKTCDLASGEAKAKAKKVLASITKLRTKKGIDGLSDFLASELNVRSVKEFDADPWALNTPSGIIDLRTGSISSNDPIAKCTKITGVSPGDQGKKRWEDFISFITGRDKEFADYLQTLIGMAAVGTVYEEGLVISYGSGGNGKSTLYGVIRRVLGDYAITVNPDVIAPARGANPEPYFIAEMRGARLVLMGETEESAAMSTAQMKRITSQDEISARVIRQSPFRFIPSHTVIMHTNFLPRLQSLDGGTKRRIAVAPFPATFPQSETITDYKSVLFDECGPAILQWIIDGAIRFYNAGCKLEKPATVVEATQKYLDNEDWLKNFLEEKCAISPGASMKFSELYSAYLMWASENGWKIPKSKRDFAKYIEGAGIEKQKTGGVIYCNGIQLQDPM